MWSQIYFHHFNLLTGSADEAFTLYEEANQWAERARALFSDLSSEDLTKAINLLDWIDDDYNHFEKALNRLDEEGQEKKRILDDMHPYHSRTSKELFAIRDEYSLASSNHNDVIKWSHITALYGINRIAEAYDEDIHQRTWRDDSDSDELARLEVANFFMYPAIELIALAEIERIKEQFIKESDENVTNKISLRNKEAAIAKHAKSKALKNKFISWYYKALNKGVFHSKAQAAAKFYAALPQEEKIFLESNAERTLLDALRAFEKEKSRN